MTRQRRKRLDEIECATERAARSEEARKGAVIMHAKHDPHETTAKARAALLARFERQVDPTYSLPEHERSARAAEARSTYYRELAYRRWHRPTAPADAAKTTPTTHDTSSTTHTRPAYTSSYMRLSA